MNYITDINHDKALLLIDAAMQAYNSFSSKEPTVCQTAKIEAPDGYEYVDCWNGTDSIFSADKTVEIYGIVFRTLEAPHTYIFSFRGTDSFLDLIDDFGAAHKPFKPFDESVSVDSGVHVESGFWDIYSESKDGEASMQQQVFALIDKYKASDKPIDQLYITGHSLGSSLCQLFTLDVALSRPDVHASNYNYASPRTGNSDFVELYERQPAQQDSETRTIRIQNTHDIVPDVPFANLGYQHTSYAFLVAFRKYTRWPHINLNWIVDNHGAGHYQAVLKCAFANADNVCLNNKLPVPGSDIYLTSTEPDQSKTKSSKKGLRRTLGI
ncbi:MAG: lipase family protein [Verrucomicrobiota bacterium]